MLVHPLYITKDFLVFLATRNKCEESLRTDQHSGEDAAALDVLGRVPGGQAQEPRQQRLGHAHAPQRRVLGEAPGRQQPREVVIRGVAAAMLVSDPDR